MKITISDLGTNTFSLLLGKATEEGYQFLYQERANVLLGVGSLQQRR